MKNQPLIGCVAGLVILCLGSAGLADSKSQGDKIEQWAAAAADRENAAAAQERQAGDQLKAAQQLRLTEYYYETERMTKMKKAGSLEVAAGEAYALAQANYERACVNWGEVANEYRRRKEEEKEKPVRARAEQIRFLSLDAFAKAAEAFEMAAEAFGADNGNDPLREGQASERAATMREILATKK